MPFILKSAKVKGFLGHLDINVSFEPDVNFIIGRNGTGKTTFVKLVHAAITVDENELFGISFDSIDISFWDDDNRTTPQLKITKLSRRQRIFKFELRNNGREKFRSFSNRAEQIENHNLSPNFLRTIEADGRVRRRSTSTSMAAELRRSILSKINLSWLPLLRSKSVSHYLFDEDEDGHTHNDPINSKISDIVIAISRYFSTLESRAARETKAFQKDYFLSLLNFTPDRTQSLVARSSKRDYDNQKKIMRDILIELGLEIDDFSNVLEVHFDRVKRAAERISSENRVLIDDYFALADTFRLEKIVERFQKYEKNKSLIFLPKIKLERLMNEFLLRKEFTFSEANIPHITNEVTDEYIELTDLSSGEKQIFVMFSETLLQDQSRHIFLADEPELSLHVEWQENLVKNIRTLNDRCQIIFATHSPDMVSVYQDRVIDFEKL